MSDFLLPPAAMVLASLVRPRFGTPVAMVSFEAGGLSPRLVAAGIQARSAELIAPLPGLLRRGDRVWVMVHLILADHIFADSMAVEVDRARPSADAWDELSADLEGSLAFTFESMRLTLAANADKPPAVQ